MDSINSFWAFLLHKKNFFDKNMKLHDFPFNEKGDLIERGIIQITDSHNYEVAPFYLNIPIDEVKEKYYLVRGCNSNFQKICLLHSSFFETIPTNELVGEAILQMLDEADEKFTDEEKEVIKHAFSTFPQKGQVLELEKASVDLKYQVELEVKPDANILSPKQYPEILDNTLNLICPFHSEDEKEDLISNVASVVGMDTLNELKIFPIKHPLNGWFLVFQTNL